MIKSLEFVTLPLVKLHSLKQVTAHCLLGDSGTAFLQWRYSALASR